MNVIHVTPSSGGSFYCQNCLRDAALLRALRQLGHDVVMAPMYLPLTGDRGEPLGDTPVFYGAVNLYLKQCLPFLSRAPRWLERWLDSPAVLGWAARKSGSTRAHGLEALTLSMLRGEDGRQAGQLDDLCAWLAQQQPKPDVIHLSNALLLGLARRLRQRLDVRIVCSLQDEDVWVDAMEPGAAEHIWGLMTERAADVDRFIAVSRYYAEKMRERLRLAPERVCVVPLGIELTGYAPAAAPVAPPVIGYLSRMSEPLGLGLLVEAFIRLKKDARFHDLRFKATGGMTGDDRLFVDGLRRRLEKHGILRDAEFAPDFTREQRLAFLAALSVLSVPVRNGEAFGMYLLEAMAAGVPVVQPRVGAFPEIVEATGGGILYSPNDVHSLTGALASLLLDPERARELGRRGRAAVERDFSIERMARDVAAVYENARTLSPVRPIAPMTASEGCDGGT
jgi:glycosyltransferase involved in cell wall biosynthesis